MLRSNPFTGQVYTLEEVAQHKVTGDAWVALSGKVYNVTSWLEHHPGGATILLRRCGKDSTEQFAKFHKPGTLEKYGAPFLIGRLADAQVVHVSTKAYCEHPNCSQPKPCETHGEHPFVIRNADARDAHEIAECTAAAFTTFEAFGPPWDQNALCVPPLVGSIAPFPRGGISRLAVNPSTNVIMGHAQWNISSMKIGSKWVLSAWLAPLSIHPSQQRHGLGGALMKDGLEQLKQAGVAVLVLMGHPNFYPRFGLLTGCFGTRGLAIALPKPIEGDDGHTLRPLKAGDETTLHTLWIKLCGEAEGAMDPGPGLLPWCSSHKGIVACCLERNGQLVGYARFDSRPGSSPATGMLRFLATDAAAAASLAARVTQIAKWTGDKLVIRLPFPQSDILPVAEAVNEWQEPAMAMSLGHREAHTLLESCRAKQKPPLFIEFPPLLDE